MKRTLAAILVALTLASPVFAKKTKPVYDLTGEAYFYAYRSDSEAHITVDGTTYSSYCSTTGTSVNCTDSAGVFEFSFSNGDTTIIRLNPDVSDRCIGLGCDPLIDRIAKNGGRVKVQYRLAILRNALGKDNYYWVPVDSTDKKGKPKQLEACYNMLIVLGADGQVKK